MLQTIVVIIFVFRLVSSIFCFLHQVPEDQVQMQHLSAIQLSRPLELDLTPLFAFASF
ncbi:hypothetical protein HanIR_Chr02g0066301 [Helianthus annuus]|nr:hypothetical protein HanIR_Chr02g0066301 [Helianthus annuus]